MLQTYHKYTLCVCNFYVVINMSLPDKATLAQNNAKWLKRAPYSVDENNPLGLPPDKVESLKQELMEASIRQMRLKLFVSAVTKRSLQSTLEQSSEYWEITKRYAQENPVSEEGRQVLVSENCMDPFLLELIFRPNKTSIVIVNCYYPTGQAIADELCKRGIIVFE